MASQSYPATGAGYYDSPVATSRGSGYSTAAIVIGFNASNFNSIYGNSSTVTPDFCSVKFFIRY